MNVETGSVHSLDDLHNAPSLTPSPADEKKSATLKHLSYVLGFIYSIFLVLLGLLLFSVSPFVSGIDVSSILLLYIFTISLLIICVVITDIKIYTNKLQKEVDKALNNHDGTELSALNQINHDNGIERSTSFSGRSFTRNTDNGFLKIDHRYCFSNGRHAGSAYIKFGAAAFALGHLVHSILLAVVHSTMITSNPQCMNIVQHISDVFYPMFSFLLLFFIFKYSNVIIVKHKNIVRVAFLHLMPANLCLWIFSVSRETQLALMIYEWSKTIKNTTDNHCTLFIWLPINTAIEGSIPAWGKDFKDVKSVLASNSSNARAMRSSYSCKPPTFIAKMYQDFSPYLYPFSVEFNIITVGILYVIWSNIGSCNHKNDEDARQYYISLYTQNHKTSGDVSNPHSLNIHINCHNSSRGMFAGMIVTVLLVVTIIMGFVFGNLNDEELRYLGYITQDCMKLTFHTTMLITAVIAYYKTRTLDVNLHQISYLDDILLFICLPAFLLETIFTTVATLNILNLIKFADTLVMSLQMVVQTIFIVDCLRRCSNSRRLRRKKPGRELVLFLLVTNVAMWILYTFSYKSSDSKDERYVFYGKELWLKLSHLCTPLIMFYRFHSSVCIADIWSNAYKPGIKEP